MRIIDQHTSAQSSSSTNLSSSHNEASSQDTMIKDRDASPNSSPSSASLSSSPSPSNSSEPSIVLSSDATSKNQTSSVLSSQNLTSSVTNQPSPYPSASLDQSLDKTTGNDVMLSPTAARELTIPHDYSSTQPSQIQSQVKITINILPPCIRCEVMSHLPDLKSLNSCALATRGFYNNFMGFRIQLVDIVLENHIRRDGEPLEFDMRSYKSHVTTRQIRREYPLVYRDNEKRIVPKIFFECVRREYIGLLQCFIRRDGPCIQTSEGPIDQESFQEALAALHGLPYPISSNLEALLTYLRFPLGQSDYYIFLTKSAKEYVYEVACLAQDSRFSGNMEELDLILEGYQNFVECIEKAVPDEKSA